MADHFEKIQKLPDPVAGCPNFRRVPGYKVYCCGQPTIAGFEACIAKVCGDIYPKDGKIIWLNLRQEPDVYVNGVKKTVVENVELLRSVEELDNNNMVLGKVKTTLVTQLDETKKIAEDESKERSFLLGKFRNLEHEVDLTRGQLEEE